MLFFNLSQKTKMNGFVFKRLGYMEPYPQKIFYVPLQFRTMGLLRYVLMAVGVMLLLLGLIYVMASEFGLRYAAIGIGLILVGVVLIFLSYKLEKAKIGQPKLVSQDIRVDTSGDVALERFKCRSCGNPLKEKDLNMVDGAVILSCPYCGNVYQLEEEPKW
jgi:predicted RNA-binding Zn-ribbon protein involved in translation (DUF1610 family)